MKIVIGALAILGVIAIAYFAAIFLIQQQEAAKAMWLSENKCRLIAASPMEIATFDELGVMPYHKKIYACVHKNGEAYIAFTK